MIFNKLKARLAAIAVAAPLAFASAPASSAVIELGLAIDASGSIANADFTLQIQAYVNALSDATVLPADGTVAIGVWLFGADVVQRFAMTQIDDEADRTALVGAFAGLAGAARGGVNTGATNITGAITAITAAITGPGPDSTSQLIDVSTDGANNVGNLGAAVTAALAAGIDQINCLGVGANANCAWNPGAPSFDVIANDFNDFETALRGKLARETGRVPEPGTLLLVGLALAGLGFARRKASA